MWLPQSCKLLSACFSSPEKRLTYCTFSSHLAWKGDGRSMLGSSHMTRDCSTNILRRLGHLSRHVYRQWFTKKAGLQKTNEPMQRGKWKTLWEMEEAAYEAVNISFWGFPPIPALMGAAGNHSSYCQENRHVICINTKSLPVPGNQAHLD